MHLLVMLPECWQLNSTEEMLLYAAQPLFKGISYLNNKFRAVSLRQVRKLHLFTSL